MVSRVKTFAMQGVITSPIDIQVHMTTGLPGVHIVGMADRSVSESKERIKAAFHNIGFAIPGKRITFNLSPTDVTKEGNHYDLPIAMALFVELGLIDPEEIAQYYIMGELSLDGYVNSIRGILPAAISANAEDCGLICPHENLKEAIWSGNKAILGVKNILDLLRHLQGEQLLEHTSETEVASQELVTTHSIDFSEVKGQSRAKRALEIAAAGGHNLLMIGPPGSGKSMLAKRLLTILPPLSKEEMLSVSIIASITGTFTNMSSVRPFRSPHHSSSMPALIGGGRNAQPGEITLAHCGVLFLDELPEFSRQVLEALRQPIEDGEVTVARVNSHTTYPANFQLIAAMNPCKCGLFDEKRGCAKMPQCAIDYKNRISAPIIDRFDMQIDVPRVGYFQNKEEKPESSEEIAKRVMRAHQIQAERYKDTKIILNAHAEGSCIEKFMSLSEQLVKILQQAAIKYDISMRGINKIIKVARTIADLEGKEEITKDELIEAIAYRYST